MKVSFDSMFHIAVLHIIVCSITCHNIKLPKLINDS